MKIFKTKKILLFLTLCIGARVGLVVLAKYLPTKWLQYMGYITLLPAFDFIFIFYKFKIKCRGSRW